MTFDIRALRIRSGLGQKAIVDRLGVSLHQLRKWERGLELPSDDIFSKLAAFFGVKESELIENQLHYSKTVTPGEGYTTRLTKHREYIPARNTAEDGHLRVLDLFSGCGGLSFGLEMTNRLVTVCAVDLLPDRLETFLANHPCAAALVGDIRESRIQDICKSAGPVDLVVGGPPCQGFSSIRPFRALTEGDKRNNLIEYFVLIVAAFKPKWVLLENVLGMLTHKKGVMLESVVRALQDIGYIVSWRVINAALYGVPQNRERIVIIGNRMGIDFKWPEPSHFVEYRSMAGSRPEVITVLPIFSQNLDRAVTVMQAISDLPLVEAGEEVNHYNEEPRNDFQKIMRAGDPQLTLHRATRHSKRMLNIIEHAGSNISHIPKDLISSGFSSCYSRLDADKPSTTLTVNFVHPASNRCIHPHQNRALTIREGARIQSFPDRFQFIGTTAQIVKQIGNAVPPLLAEVLGEAIYTAHHSRVNA